MILKCDWLFFLKFCLLWFKCQTVLFGMVILTFCLLWFMVQKKEYNFTVHYSSVITWEIVWFYYDENKTGG